MATAVRGEQQHAILPFRGGSLDIPDELYRRFKARSATEGRPIRSVAVDLFQKWLEEKPEPAVERDVALNNDKMPWLAIARRYVREDQNHDMDGSPCCNDCFRNRRRPSASRSPNPSLSGFPATSSACSVPAFGTPFRLLEGHDPSRVYLKSLSE